MFVPWLERTHYHLPPTTASPREAEVLLYRTSGLPKKLCFSTRTNASLGTGGWTTPAESNIPDMGSNLNAGTLPTGEVYLLSNPIVGAPPRNPLVLSLSKDGLLFDRAFILATCLLHPYANASAKH